MSTPESPFGRMYARVGPRMDRRGADAHRQELVDGLSGDIVEIGAGYGATFPYYPRSVRSVTALEPDADLRRRAESAAATIRTPIRVEDGRAERIPLPSGSVDAVVFSLVLCSVEDQSVALAEAALVLKPAGTLAFYEHVKSSRRLAGLVGA